MGTLKTACDACKNQFLILEKEQGFLTEKGLPLPTKCQSCRQQRRLLLRGGRQLFKTICQKCKKPTIVSFDPTKVKNMILCKEDYDRYFEENDSIISDPLPQLL